MDSHNSLPEEVIPNLETVQVLSHSSISEKEASTIRVLQENESLQTAPEHIFDFIAYQGILFNEFATQQKNAMEIESDSSKKNPKGVKQPSPSKSEESEILSPQVASKKLVFSTTESQKGLTGSTGLSSESKPKFLEAPRCADRNQYGNLEGEQICDDPSPKTQVGSYVSGENCSNQKPTLISANSPDLIQHEVEDLSTRASSPQDMKVGMHPNSKNIKKETGRQPQNLKNNEKTKRQLPSQSTAYKNKYIYIARTVLSLLGPKTKFRVVFNELCRFYDVDPDAVKDYLSLRITGSKEGGKTKTGNDQDQAKVANKNDVANLLHEEPGDDFDLWRLKKGARLAFERFFMDAYYEIWAEEKCEKLSEEVLGFFMKKKEDIYRDFVPDRNEFLSSQCLFEINFVKWELNDSLY